MPWEKAYLQKKIFFWGDKQFRSSHLDKNRNEKHKKKRSLSEVETETTNYIENESTIKRIIRIFI